jgi:hypothetical protein
MLHKNSGKRLRERLAPYMRAAALPAALCTTWYTACAQAQEAQQPSPTAASSSALAADEALFTALPANLERLPAPAIAPPVTARSRRAFVSSWKPGRSPGFSPRGRLPFLDL